MKTYRYDHITKEYLYSETAFLDPLETKKRGKDVYLLPADSTFSTPPEKKEGFAILWNGSSWGYIEDHRKKPGVEGSGTPYWLPGDSWWTPARYMMELGPLPDGALLEAPKKDIDTIKAEKLVEINAEYDAATSALVVAYPQTELLTFDKQEAEARAWTADNSAETPLVDMLAAGRQMDKAELVRRILVKADAFALATGYLTGQRQRFEDLLKAAETIEAVEAIEPKYSMPEGLSI